MLALNFYKSSFEEKFLQTSTEFFKAEAERKMTELQLADYALFVNKTLDLEKERVELCLDISSKGRLIELIEKQLIYWQTEKILVNEGFDKLINEKKTSDLSLIYSLLKRVEQ